MRADRRDMTPRQLKMRAPNRTDPRVPSWEGQLDWQQSRAVGVSYFAHLLRWALSRSALSATTDASTTQQWDWKYTTLSGTCGELPTTGITGACTIDPPRISNEWRNFSIRASCRFIRDPHDLWHTWSTCPSVSVRPQQSDAVIAPGRPRAARFLVETVAPRIWIACINADPDIKAVPSDTHECTCGTPALVRSRYPSAEPCSCSARASFAAGAEVTVMSPTLTGGSPHLFVSSAKVREDATSATNTGSRSAARRRSQALFMNGMVSLSAGIPKPPCLISA